MTDAQAAQSAQSEARDVFDDRPDYGVASLRAILARSPAERVLRLYEQKIADAYVAIALLADRCGIYDHPQVQAALDYFCDPTVLGTGWSLQADALQPGTEWQGEPAEPFVDGAYWG